MAILRFTKADKLASSVMPAGYYSLEVVEIGEPTVSGSKKSMNMHSKFCVIDDEKYTGKELKVAFNTKMDRPAVMGTMVLMPHTWIDQLAAATADIDVLEVPEELDTDSLKGQKFDAKVEKVIVDGVILNTISGFLPYGVGRKREAEGLPF